MSELFEIGAEGVDVGGIMREIEERVARKKAAGVYDRYDLSRFAALEIGNVKSEGEFLDYALRVIAQTWDIDIADFPIHSKGGLLGRPSVLFKKAVWKLLKFYTYRLFSQQKEFNCQVANAITSLKQHVDSELAALKERDNGGDGLNPKSQILPQLRAGHAPPKSQN